MKACTGCGRLYPEDSGFCPVDGLALENAQFVPVAPNDEDKRVGKTVCARYHMRRVVADGGMGRVYEALDREQERSVAVKILHPEVAANEIAVERFKREFAVSAQLPHAHIVEVVDFQPTHDGSYALVMEFLYGEELRATLRRVSALGAGRLVRIMSQVAIGLDEAHARKFVHRDLKPDNLFLCQTTDGDMVKLLDFGSVKDTGEGAKKLTIVGTTIGSPYYMSPEQAQGLDTLDHRADVWALATIAYECLTGDVPFKGNNGPSILLAIVTAQPVPVSQRTRGENRETPVSVDRALGRAMRKDAQQRTPTAGAFADDLGAAFGLEGDHIQWAEMPEDELERRIQQALPGLLAESDPPPRSTDADTSQGVDSLIPPPISEPAAPVLQPSARQPAAAVATAPAWLLPAVVVIALLAGVLIARMIP